VLLGFYQFLPFFLLVFPNLREFPFELSAAVTGFIVLFFTTNGEDTILSSDGRIFVAALD